MSIERYQNDETVRIDNTLFVDETGAAETDAAGKISIMRESDNQFWNGSLGKLLNLN